MVETYEPTGYLLLPNAPLVYYYGPLGEPYCGPCAEELEDEEPEQIVIHHDWQTKRIPCSGCGKPIELEVEE
jgi:hypothetical protein